MINIEFTHDYGTSNDQVMSLYEKSRRLQWDIDRDIDWSLPFDPSHPILGSSTFPIFELPMFQRLSRTQQETLNARFTANALSQFVHGEQGALLVAAMLTSVCPQYEAKLFASAQAYDEARHLEVFSRYVRRCGGLEPPDPQMKKMLDAILGADHWAKAMVGMQIIVEGVALTAFHSYRKSTRDPVLQNLLQLVLRDEARHVSFGQVFLTRAVEEDDALADEIADFTVEAIRMWATFRQSAARKTLPLLMTAGVDPEDMLKELAAAERSGQNIKNRPAQGQDALESFILPALKRTGLMNEVLVTKIRQQAPRVDLDHIDDHTSLLDHLRELS